jgi:hypothetical protein
MFYKRTFEMRFSRFRSTESDWIFVLFFFNIKRFDCLQQNTFYLSWIFLKNEPSTVTVLNCKLPAYRKLSTNLHKSIAISDRGEIKRAFASNERAFGKLSTGFNLFTCFCYWRDLMENVSFWIIPHSKWHTQDSGDL